MRILASEGILFKQASSKLGERQESILGSRSKAKRGVKGEGDGEGGGKANMAANLVDRELILKTCEHTENASMQAKLSINHGIIYGTRRYKFCVHSRIMYSCSIK